ncbi:elongation factor G [Mesoterricola silvestris]|uniref:Tetracycline resistance protein n=1 Tax=Mesoterricola silvestris TaxID=2927979 RepID=A0AA48GKB4_9BACT|nr:TetM/TetW/TetO/TetS family tetracycline resistance ribosomal protection protein [Mesoterricola silvestris]BDU71339.1 tetracycline resistance protein [Mesoterricola silvestris]
MPEAAALPFPPRPQGRPVRTLGILAHVDAGKTTLTEQMLFASGAIRALGSVDLGTAHTDGMEVERERGISVRSAVTTFPWRQVEINLIDTPGHVDFGAEVERSLRVLDGAVLVLSAVEGIQAQTAVLWKALRRMGIPTIIFINKTDRMGADPAGVLAQVQRRLTPLALVLPCPGEAFPQCPGNDWAQTVERVAEQDETILGHWAEGRPVAPELLRERMADLARGGSLHPVLFGAALKGQGVEPLLDAMVDCLPAPAGDVEGPVSGLVFKLEHDKTMGRIAYVRLFGGELRNRDAVANATQGTLEKITQIRRVRVQRHEDAGLLQAGDIGSVCGLQARIGDVLGDAGGVPEGCALAVPLLTVQAFAAQEADFPRLVAALRELADEDPMLGLEWLRDERELHLRIMGVIQMEVLTSLLATRFGLEARFGPPSVIYRETPSGAGEGYVEYTMPKPCWAVMKFALEPGEPGSGVAFASTVRNDAMLLRYQNQVENALPGALKQGLHGWEVTDIRITLVEGQHHLVHTHPLDFAVATPMGIMNGLEATGTTLLEPMLACTITVPAALGNRVIGDILQMRGTFEAPALEGGEFTVEATIPVATSLDYPTRLGSLSGGRGVLSTRFAGYQPCPLELGATSPRRGIDPRDQAKYILAARKAL